MKGYPHVLSEHETLERVHTGKALARFGDGELRIALGRDCISQRERFPKLVAELHEMLAKPGACLVGIPNVYSATPKKDSWLNYAKPGFTALYRQKGYASSFITRPDSAPWIDTPEYWARIADLWRGKDVTLVIGDKRSLRSEALHAEATSICEVWGPRQNAYREIDRIEEEIGKPAGPVLMCMGVTATVLAYRLAQKGVHAIDLGHIGMFMRHAGAYNFKLDDLISPEYRAQLAKMHDTRTWGDDGAKHVEPVRQLADEVQAATILDYGCGAQRLAEAMKPRRVSGYDPGIAGREGMPKPCDVVVCTDVLEHVEPDKLPRVLEHLRCLSGKAAYVVIATRPANAVLPDGRNAHLIVESPEWWADKFADAGWKNVEFQAKAERQIVLWLRK